MSSKDTQMKPCPSWCAGTHDLITTYGECVHSSSPVPLLVGDEAMRVYIESYVESGFQDPPPGKITWDFAGVVPSLTAREAGSFAAILGGLVSRLGKAAYRR
jgi:hypothetical protein